MLPIMRGGADVDAKSNIIRSFWLSLRFNDVRMRHGPASKSSMPDDMTNWDGSYSEAEKPGVGILMGLGS